MRTSTIAWVIIILIVLGGGFWYYTSMQPAAPASTQTSTEAGSPSGAAGINGSANQGNLGQPDNGLVQEPGADGAEGSVVGNNLVLGTDGNAALGTYLIAYNGMTLYLYTKDTTSASTCYDQCAVNWPPYVIGPEDNIANVKLGVTATKVGTTRRTDGTIQVTYDGHPLYFWKNDKKSGDTSGQNVGGVWFVVKP